MIAKRSTRSFRTSLMQKNRQEKERLYAYISSLIPVFVFRAF
jgi:hypothetical protein